MSAEEIEKMTYTQAVAALEDIVARMQSPECDIDHLADYTSNALKLMTHCKSKLRKTEEEVQRALESI